MSETYHDLGELMVANDPVIIVAQSRARAVEIRLVRSCIATACCPASACWGGEVAAKPTFCGKPRIRTSQCDQLGGPESTGEATRAVPVLGECEDHRAHVRTSCRGTAQAITD